MLTPHPLPSELFAFLQCPVCYSAIDQLHCKQCNTQFFRFGNIMSLLPAGLHQLHAWQHQTATMNLQAQQNQNALREFLTRYDLLEPTRRRAEDALRIAEACNEDLLNLLNEAGIQPQLHEQFEHSNLGSISEYYHHILQDWAWDKKINAKKLQHALAVCPKKNIGSMMVLGAGAGRLSWDLHNALDAKITLATDINPMLLLAANTLIRQQQSFRFTELNSFPQIGKHASKMYQLTPAEDPNNKRHSWFPLAANVWRMPIKPHSLDMVVTSWFIDVHGGDNRDLIGLIRQWLKPEGLWLNTGPLLYPRAAPFEIKYDRDELVSLMTLGGFKMRNEQLNEEIHLNSPINVRTQTEQIWSFCAQQMGADEFAQEQRSNPLLNNPKLPPWLALTHLPIPNLSVSPKLSHPLIDLVLSLIDGNTSIQQLCDITAPHMPEGIDVKEALVALFGELLEEG